MTDNLPYGKSLIGIVYDLKNGSGSSNGGGGGRGESAAGDGADDAVGAHSNSDSNAGDQFGQDVVASCGSVCLYEGMPGASHGYMTGTTSYFDRLWQSGRKNRRFFLSAAKEELV